MHTSVPLLSSSLKRLVRVDRIHNDTTPTSNNDDNGANSIGNNATNDNDGDISATQTTPVVALAKNAKLLRRIPRSSAALATRRRATELKDKLKNGIFAFMKKKALEQPPSAIIFVILNFLLERNVSNIEVFNVEQHTTYTNKWVVVDCPSSKSLFALSQGLRKLVRSTLPNACVDSPRAEKAWVVLDAGEVWVHFFSPDGQKQRHDICLAYRPWTIPLLQWPHLGRVRTEPVYVDIDTMPKLPRDDEHNGLI